MSSLVFKNSGLIDVRAITTFGISSKENNNAIGYFGTGLKYAIAVLMREGCDMTIYSGKDKYTFSVKRETIRVNEFEIVQMNGKPLPFTTELGKNWQVWQAYRELYCNCKDENGEVFLSDSRITLDSNSTTIVVTGSKILNVHLNDTTIFLKDREALTTANGVEIHSGTSNYIYYRGVKVYELPERSLFTYNIIDETKLTEDRTLLSYWDAKFKITCAIARCTSVKIIEAILLAPKTFLEYNFDFDYGSLQPCETFTKLCTDMYLDKNTGMNISARTYVRKTSNIEHLLYTDFELTTLQKDAFDRAVNFLKELGYPVDKYNIRTVEDLGRGIVGLAKYNTIFLARHLFLLGIKQIASCLLEEYVHLEHHLVDESRELQTFLFDTVITQGETILGRNI